MKQYIDKSDVVAEIKRRIKEYNTPVDRLGSNNIRLHECKDILSFLNTLEVKENDLVEELDYDDYMTFFKEHPEYNNGDWGFEETWTFGQYCYTLGLKAQKGDKL